MTYSFDAKTKAGGIPSFVVYWFTGLLVFLMRGLIALKQTTKPPNYQTSKLIIFLGIFSIFFSAPLTTHAAPLSPWVQEVLDRVDDGISYAGTVAAPLGCVPGDDQQQMIAQSFRVVRAYVDMEMQVTMQAASLKERTACLQSDLNLMEKKLEEIRRELDVSIDSCDKARAEILVLTYSWLGDAIKSLAANGSDPVYQDDRLNFTYNFHDPQLWGSGTRKLPINPPTEPRCPYTTDYSPQSIGFVPDPVGMSAGSPPEIMSFGCDESVVNSFGDPVDRHESVPYSAFLRDTDTFARQLSDMVSQFWADIQNAVNAVRGISATVRPFTLQPQPPHGEQSGCLKPVIGPIEPEDGGINGERWPNIDLQVLADWPDYFETIPSMYVGSEIYYVPPRDEILPTGMITRPSYGNFLVMSDALVNVDAYLARRGLQGFNRPLPEFMSNNTQNFFWLLRNHKNADNFRRITENIERQIGHVDAAHRDVLDQMMYAAEPLKKAVNDLTKTINIEADPFGGTDKGSLPKYIQDLIYFLRRQCVDGHCQETLDNVAKRIYNPFCTPFVSGAYLDPKSQARCMCIVGGGENELDAGADADFIADYCSPAPTADDQARYGAMTPELIPGCQ